MAENHGNTPAAWTAVIVALAGFVVGAAGLMFDPVKMAIFWVGVVVVLVAGVLYAVMNKLGYGDS